ncbi:outer dense fiber protein 2-like isoform X2 [Mizuhopecten yessoensis]|uniref:outer dense fiber protein 2-like isoform X2 n=1 Tax=Mizuhopecten yessoensis TaxID=6573 RepID=UPI000B45912F|nr:outer dense fiber protein 2-like isoform X2 [Mizuhopecten yessoensis]
MGKRGVSADKGLRPTSPVHVHVDDDIPIHVHVKQKGKSKTRKVPSVGGPVRPALSKRSTASARSKSPGGAWVPPPGKATKGSKVTWQGPTHRLEMSNPRETLHMSDLDTDEEEQVHGQMRNYEKKIEGLMSEVGTLKNEAELQKTLKEMVHKDDLLHASRHVMHEQERELDEYKDELDITEHENQILRRSMENLNDEAAYSRLEVSIASGEREKLMKKLIEVEMDGQTAVKHIGELRDVVRRLREENKLTHGDSVRYGKQKDILLEKLADFEATNRTLRRLLREQHHAEAAALRMGEQRDGLVMKLSDSERQNERLRIELMDRDRLIGDMRANITAQKEENIALNGLQTTLESTRAHLQKQLRTKEADCNRMAVQIRTIDGSKAQDKIEIEHLTELLSNAKEKAERDKEALKKATRVQKQRATRSEDALEQLNIQMMERDSQLEDMRTQLDQMGPRYDKLSKEKSQLLAENSALTTRLGELESLMDRVENNTKIHQENTTAELHDKQGQLSSLKIENERLKTSITTIEEKFRAADEELVQLRGNLKHYENLVDEYKTQMNRCRIEADDTMVRLEETVKESELIQEDGEYELEKVKARLHNRLQELEPLPDMLKTTELKLHDANERIIMYERKNTENTKLITELTAKVEHVSDTLEQMRSKCHDMQDDNRLLQGKVESVERKLHDAEDHCREMMTAVAKAEETAHQQNLRLEEKNRENASLTRQLENALSDIRRQNDQSRDKASQKERTYLTRITDLESQISQCRAEIARLKREKEENERKFNSRLYDLKDRLEQSHSTNRSMQNYVQFLKNSYANVFGESSISYPSTPGLP